jgi:hypothetical protein
MTLGVATMDGAAGRLRSETAIMVPLRAVIMAAIIATAAVLSGFGIGKYPFWDDEAGTALFARSIIQLAVVPLLLLPWFNDRFRPQRPLAIQALVACAMMLTVLSVVAALSPQDPSVTQTADMRYALPAMVIGAAVTAGAIAIVGSWSRLAAAGLACLLVFSNAGYVGPTRLRCTLCERLQELADDHPSGTAAMIAATEGLASGTSVVVRPAYTTLPLMYYRPDLRYPDVLAPDKLVVSSVRSRLPDWVFCCHVAPDVILFGIGSVASEADFPLNGHGYQEVRAIPYYWLDQTRPELPWHRFRPDPVLDRNMGIAVLRRVDTRG